MLEITRYDHYRAHALQAYLLRGYDMQTAIDLSRQVANKINGEEESEDIE